jgi:hypothetical protein
LPFRGRIDHVDVPIDDLRERILIAIINELPKEIAVGHGRYVQIYSPIAARARLPDTSD